MDASGTPASSATRRWVISPTPSEPSSRTVASRIARRRGWSRAAPAALVAVPPWVTQATLSARQPAFFSGGAPTPSAAVSGSQAGSRVALVNPSAIPAFWMVHETWLPIVGETISVQWSGHASS